MINPIAYIDPGTGSLVMQMLVAGFFGALFAIKIFWSKLKILATKPFRKNRAKDTSPDSK